MKKAIVIGAIVGFLVPLLFLSAFYLGFPNSFDNYYAYMWPTWILMLDNDCLTARVISVGSNMLIYSVVGCTLYGTIIGFKRIIRG